MDTLSSLFESLRERLTIETACTHVARQSCEQVLANLQSTSGSSKCVGLTMSVRCLSTQSF